MGVLCIVRVSSERVATHEAVSAVDRLGTCLFGDVPPNDAAALLRVHASQLAVLGGSARSWPGRCAPLARTLAEEERGRDLGVHDAAQTLARALDDRTSAFEDLGKPLLALLRAERAAGRVAHTAPEIPGPPEPVHALTVDSLDPRAMLAERPLPLSGIHFAPFADDTLTWLVDDPHVDRARYCVYALGGSLRCVPVASRDGGRVGSELRLWGTRDAPGPGFAFAGDHGAGGITRIDTGEPLDVSPLQGIFGAHALAGGAIDLVASRAGSPEVHLFHFGGGVMHESPLLGRTEIGNPSYNVGLFWSFVVTKGPVAGASGVHLRVREVKDGEPGPVVDVGEVGKASRVESGGERHLEGCRSGGAMGLRVKGWDTEYFSFHEGGWTAPVPGPPLAGLLFCRGAEAVIVEQKGHVEDGRYEPRITENRCTSSRCDTTAIETRDVWKGSRETTPEQARDVAVAALGDGVLLVWSAGDVAGLRMRRGKLRDLADAQEVVLFDDHVEHGERRVDSSLVELVARPVVDGCLLWLGTSRGVFVYRVDMAGRLSPVYVD
jgi:hypothetical protein